MPFFSPSTLGFYDPACHDRMPDDVVEVTPESYAALMAGQASGQRIAIGEDGAPCLAPHDQPTDAEACAAVKAEARKRLAATDYTQTADVAALLKNAEAFCEYRAALRAIFKAPTALPDWPAAPDPAWA
ncbi:MAG: hypothetical protein OC190_00240 [Novosphingobium aromaticivorans]|nr:hypothetical protein [Novosphingobium aromaticivorans]